MSATSAEKETLRRRIRALRRVETDRDARSRRIFTQLGNLEEWNGARTVLYHVGARDEVPTLAALHRELAGTRRVAVPWCADDDLLLTRLTRPDQLVPGAFGILEPALEWRTVESMISPLEIDAALIPGLVFASDGNRLGYGRGYFDRLLSRLRPDCLKIGVAFDCQIVESVPTEPHDRPVNMIVTPTRILRVG